MYARMITGQILPEKIDEAIQLWSGMVKPSIRKRKGFIISRFMVDRELNKVVVLSMWMRKEDVYESAEWTRQQIDQFTQMLVAPPMVEILEVAGEVERII